jgi:putative Holliday junction resolvase
MTGRILAIDYGRRRVGLAISDPTGTIATGLETLLITGVGDAVSKVIAVRAEWEYDLVVVGLPLKTTGEPGPMAEEVRTFVELLKAACDVPVRTIDERFSSAEATRILHQTGKRIRGHKSDIDRLAAELILRQYLDSLPETPATHDH